MSSTLESVEPQIPKDAVSDPLVEVNKDGRQHDSAISAENPTADSTSLEPKEIVELSKLSKDAQARIEVALYAAGRPLSLDEISLAAKTTSKKRLALLMMDLSRKVNSTFGAIELKVIEGPMYSLQLKPEFNSIAKKFASKPLLSISCLRTLSFVVYLQPVSAAELVQRRGSQVYSQLKDLIASGFVRAERRGRGRVFSTTDNFADYFGLSHEVEQQRKQVAKQGLLSKAQTIEKKVQDERLTNQASNSVSSAPS